MNNLKEELKILKVLDFEQIKPLLWAKEESIGTLFFDYREDIKRKTYAKDLNDKEIDKTQFETYSLFHMILKRKERMAQKGIIN